MFKQKIARFIEEKKLCKPQDKLLVALSGGADSVALLRVLLQEGYDCVAAHCNFHLRGDESNRDERFVQALCETHGVELHISHFNTTGHAAAKGISIEMAARELRYAWFETLREAVGADAIAVAHHRDDSVETFLLNLVRGTGINGLKGIRPVNGRIIRPLLDVSRKEILDYLSALQQPYVTDSTNLQDDYTRNKIRLDVLPLLRDINPSVDAAIAATSQRLSDVQRVYQEAICEICSKVIGTDGVASIPALLASPSPRAVLFEWLHAKGFNAAQLHDIFRSLSAESGRIFYAPHYKLLRDRDTLQLRPRKPEEDRLPELAQQLITIDSSYVPPHDKHIACLDADRLPSSALSIRKWRSGDKFVPLGMRNFKTVRDYLRDRKRSLFEKEQQCVVCCGNDIVWLVNERIDHRYRVTSATQRMLLLTTH